MKTSQIKYRNFLIPLMWIGKGMLTQKVKSIFLEKLESHTATQYTKIRYKTT